MSMTTTRDSFPVEDITHKPRRSQSDNLRNAQSEVTVSAVSTDSKELSNMPLTLERAISYYETHAVGELAHLYRFTATMLRYLLLNPTNKNIESEAEEASE